MQSPNNQESEPATPIVVGTVGADPIDMALYMAKHDKTTDVPMVGVHVDTLPNTPSEDTVIDAEDIIHPDDLRTPGLLEDGTRTFLYTVENGISIDMVDLIHRNIAALRAAAYTKETTLEHARDYLVSKCILMDPPAELTGDALETFGNNKNLAIECIDHAMHDAVVLGELTTLDATQESVLQHIAVRFPEASEHVPPTTMGALLQSLGNLKLNLKPKVKDTKKIMKRRAKNRTAKASRKKNR